LPTAPRSVSGGIQQLLQTASVIGKDVPSTILTAITDLSEEAWCLHTLGEVAAQPDRPDVERVVGRYREALALAAELEMRPRLSDSLPLSSPPTTCGTSDPGRGHSEVNPPGRRYYLVCFLPFRMARQ
jgi:hypothetical protein